MGAVLLAVVLAVVVVVTAAVVWGVMRLMTDDADDDRPVVPGRGRA
jgi:hypothetical protein